MELKTGEVIRSRRKSCPFIFHYGIVVNFGDEIYILHNPQHGKPIAETPEDFFKDRLFEKSYGVKTHRTAVELLQKFDTLKDKPFKLWSFNCEDFVNEMSGTTHFKSGKIQLAVFILLILFALLYFILR